MPTDPVLHGFLERQFVAGMELAERSDVLTLKPLGGPPTQKFIADFQCKGVVWARRQTQSWNLFRVGIFFPEDYLRDDDATVVLTILSPPNVWHPNVIGPAICAGPMPNGTGLVDLLYQVYEILSYQRLTMDERNALNIQACSWARQHQDQFPIDPQPLVRRMNVR